MTRIASSLLLLAAMTTAAHAAGEEGSPAAETPAPAEPPRAAGATIEVKYDKGLTFVSSDESFELKVGLRSQTRLEVLKQIAGPDGYPEEFSAHFLVPRLRLQLEGFAFGKANAYKVEFDMANKGSALLKDWFYDHDFGGVHLRAGQWKKPFNRQELVSDFGSEFNERAITNEFIGAGRDLGVALHNNYEKSPDGLEWAVGLFNAGSEKPSATPVKCTDPTDASTCTVGTPSNVPADFGPMLVLHVGFNLGGIKGYSEQDLEGGPFRLAVGASYKVNFKDLDKDADDKSLMEHAVAIDLMIKVSGFDLTGAFYVKKSGQEDTLTGFYAQAGYMVMPRFLGVAARFAQIPDEASDGETIMEVLGGVDVYLNGSHSWKWMTDFGVIQQSVTDGKGTLQIRTQLQLVL